MSWVRLEPLEALSVECRKFVLGVGANKYPERCSGYCCAYQTDKSWPTGAEQIVPKDLGLSASDEIAASVLDALVKPS